MNTTFKTTRRTLTTPEIEERAASRDEQEFNTETKELKNILGTLSTAQRDDVIGAVKTVRITNKKMGQLLGPKLAAIRPQLTTERRWGKAAKEIARVTGVAFVTIVRWSEGNYSIPKDKNKMAIDIDTEITKLNQKLLAAGYDITVIHDRTFASQKEIADRQHIDLTEHALKSLTEQNEAHIDITADGSVNSSGYPSDAGQVIGHHLLGKREAAFIENIEDSDKITIGQFLRDNKERLKVEKKLGLVITTISSRIHRSEDTIRRWMEGNYGRRASTSTASQKD